MWNRLEALWAKILRALRIRPSVASEAPAPETAPKPGPEEHGEEKPPRITLGPLVLLVALGCATCALPCHAQVPDSSAAPLFSFARLSVGLKAAAVNYEFQDPDVPSRLGLLLSAVLSYKLTEELGVVGSYGRDWDAPGGDLDVGTVGLRSVIGTVGPVKVGALVDRVYYRRPGAYVFGKKDSFRIGGTFAWQAWTTRGREGKPARDILYASGEATYDTANGSWMPALALNWRIY